MEPQNKEQFFNASFPNFAVDTTLIVNLFLQASKAAKILYTFTRSDIETCIIPVTFYGLLSSPHFWRPPSVPILTKLLSWIYLFILQLCTANQMYSLEEDLMNKPYRPIPSGIISVQHTVYLRWALLPVCLWVSWMWGVLRVGVLLTVACWLYNEGELSSHWYSKSFMNAVGIVLLDIGASDIASAGQPSLIHEFPLAPVCSVGLICSTMHIQDFRDEVGDRMQGRVTLPTLLPVVSRWMTLFLILLWSFGLDWYWGSMTAWRLHIFMLLGAYLAVRVYLKRTEAEDKKSLSLYMAWLFAARSLPFLSYHGFI